MVTLAEILRRHWPAYERKFRARLLPSHRRAVTALLSCRTAALGGQFYRCDCGREHYAWHSCNHRACPRCGHADATEWLHRQRRKLLRHSLGRWLEERGFEGTFDVQRRGEEVPVAEYVALAQAL